MKNPDVTRWRVCRDFQSAAWPDGAVVYDKAAGDTHQLTPAAAQILALIQDTPCTLQTLASCVLPSDSAPPDQTALSAIEAIITDLSELGFIEPEPH